MREIFNFLNFGKKKEKRNIEVSKKIYFGKIKKRNIEVSKNFNFGNLTTRKINQYRSIFKRKHKSN